MHICLQFLETLPPIPYRGSATGPRWGVPPSRPPACPPPNSWLRPWLQCHVAISKLCRFVVLTLDRKMIWSYWRNRRGWFTVCLCHLLWVLSGDEKRWPNTTCWSNRTVCRTSNRSVSCDVIVLPWWELEFTGYETATDKTVTWSTSISAAMIWDLISWLLLLVTVIITVLINLRF